MFFRVQGSPAERRRRSSTKITFHALSRVKRGREKPAKDSDGRWQRAKLRRRRCCETAHAAKNHNITKILKKNCSPHTHEYCHSDVTIQLTHTHAQKRKHNEKIRERQLGGALESAEGKKARNERAKDSAPHCAGR